MAPKPEAQLIRALREKSSDFYIKKIQEKYQLENRQAWDVFSIDPEHSRDLDDAFSIKKTEKGTLLSIYISNVSLWLDIMNLWDSFSQRIATIYLPDRKRPMLPTILSDALCSLLEKNIRFAFTLDILVINNMISNVEFKNTSVVLTKNFAYGNKKLLRCPQYKLLMETIRNMNEIPEQQYITQLNDSHDVIAYIMILMNKISGKKLEEFRGGIFRSIQLKVEQKKLPKNLPQSVLKFVKGWNSAGGCYVRYDEYRNHDLLNIESYVHITSPIRRLVDLLNILELQDKLNILKMNEKTSEFYNKWYSKLDYINATMRSIRKVQNNCALLNKCFLEKNPVYDGFLFDKMERNDGLFQYMVYLPDLKMVNRLVISVEHKNYSKHSFKIYIFMDEDRLKQKIRIDIISSYNICPEKGGEKHLENVIKKQKGNKEGGADGAI